MNHKTNSRIDSINCLSVLSDHKIVPDNQIKLFCEILQFRSELGEGLYDVSARARYKRRIQPLIKSLKFPLEKPRALVKLILPKQSEYTNLCDLHQDLNADFVHQWFKLLALEVGARLEILRNSNEKDIGSYAWNHCIKALTRLHKIWETADRVEEAFGDFVEKGLNEDISLVDVRPQLDRCEACVLTRIGGHVGTVLALRAVVKSRITPESQAKHPKRLRLLRLIEHWIMLWMETNNDKRGSKVTLQNKELHDNDRLSEELWEKRRELELEQQRARRAQRHLLDGKFSASKKCKDMAKSFSENVDNDSIYDAENDIIDTYAALRQTQRTSRLFSAILANSQALEASFASETVSKPVSKTRKTEKSGQGDACPYLPNTNPAYLESRYSIDTIRNNERALLAKSAVLTALEETPQGLTELAQASQTKRSPLPVAQRDAEGKFIMTSSLSTNEHTREEPKQCITFAPASRTGSGKFENPRKAPYCPSHGSPYNRDPVPLPLTLKQQARKNLSVTASSIMPNDVLKTSRSTSPSLSTRTPTRDSIWTNASVEEYTDDLPSPNVSRTKLRSARTSQMSRVSSMTSI